MYYQDEEELPKKLPESVVALTDMIEEMFDKSPKDRRKKKEVEKWRAELNELIKEVNKRAGHKLYSRV